jgi:perosamine synthetase
MPIRIPLALPSLGDAEWQAVRRVIESGWVAQGPVVQEFENSVADYCGASHAVAVSSCTAALHLALICAGVGPGDEVIVPSMSFIATANAVTFVGATPVFAEVEPDTFNLAPDDVLRRLSSRTRAIVVVHQLGLPADLQAFRALAQEHELVLIEDAACALGSEYDGVPIGRGGDLVCLSFHPRKVITTGEGGMVLTSSPEHADRLRRLRHHGMSVSDLERHNADAPTRETYLEIGFNYRMSDLQAAVGVEQMRRLPEILQYRRLLADEYDRAFEGSPVVRVPVRSANVSWNVQTYAIRLAAFDEQERDAVIGRMFTRGIATRPGVMTIHREPPYANPDVRLPVSEQASDCSLMIPLHAAMTLSDAQDVAQELLQCVAEGHSQRDR